MRNTTSLAADDPFAIEGLIEDLKILVWNPMFSCFAVESNSRQQPRGWFKKRPR